MLCFHAQVYNNEDYREAEFVEGQTLILRKVASPILIKLVFEYLPREILQTGSLQRKVILHACNAYIIQERNCHAGSRCYLYQL